MTDPMRISVTRTGGFAGIQRQAALDTAGRSDAMELQILARAALASSHATAPRGIPDGFGYELVVDGRTVHFAEPSLTEAQRELVSRVLKEGA